MDRLILFASSALGPGFIWLLVTGESPPLLLWPASLVLAVVVLLLLRTVFRSATLSSEDEEQRIARWLERQRQDAIGSDWKPPKPPDDV
jgi:hypothetical protein